MAAVNQPPVDDGAAAAGGGDKPSPAAQRKVWGEPGVIQLPKRYDATTSVVKGIYLLEVCCCVEYTCIWLIRAHVICFYLYRYIDRCSVYQT